MTSPEPPAEHGSAQDANPRRPGRRAISTGTSKRTPPRTTKQHRAIAAIAPGVIASPLPSVVVALDGRFLLANPSYCRLVGRSPEQLHELNVADVTHPDDMVRAQQVLRAVARGQLREHQVRKRYLRPNGEVVAVSIHGSAVQDDKGLPVGLFTNVLEVNEHAGGSLCHERSFGLLFASNPQPMWVFDLQTLRFLEVNDAACAHYGYTRTQFLERTIADIRPPEELPALHSYLATHASGLHHNGVFRHRRSDGQVIEVAGSTHDLTFDGRDAVLVTIQDMTERNMLERQLMDQALHHPLTGLPNRALFFDRLAQVLPDAGPGRLVGVLYVDLDDFHLVNESLGPEAGDAILAELGARFAARVPPEVTVGSVAGTDFAVCVGGLSDPFGALALARQIQSLVEEPLMGGDGGQVNLSACVGVAATAEPGSVPALLLRSAADALVRAKDLGPAHAAVANDEHPPSAPRGRLGARQRLRQAIEVGEIVVHYQPVVSLSDRSIVGAEALARWEHPERGLLPPAEFIPLAEETGLIAPLGRVMLEQTCRDMVAQLPRVTTGNRPFVVSVNVSGHQLRRGELVPLVRRIIEESGLEPARLALEMTETALIAEGDSSGAELAALRDIGVHLSLDDFGTGYSSLTRLDQHPFDIVKIDRSFVTGMHEDSRHQRIVAGVISLAASLGSVVVAEGVESEAEVRHLRHLGATLAQGYHFFAPMPLEPLCTLLADSGNRTARR